MSKSLGNENRKEQHGDVGSLAGGVQCTCYTLSLERISITYSAKQSLYTSSVSRGQSGIKGRLHLLSQSTHVSMEKSSSGLLVRLGV